MRTPVILITGPYFGVGTDPTDAMRPKILDYYSDLFDVAFERGYSIVQVSLRGFGSSEGCPDFGGVGEQADAHAAVEWAASRSWSTGEVGTWGLSYDAVTQVMNLDDPPRGLSAAVIMAPSIEHYRTLYMNGVPYMRNSVLPAYYSTLNLLGPGFAQPAPPEAVAPGSSAENPLCLEEAASLSREAANRDRRSAFWSERNYIPGTSDSRVPVLWAQGLYDEATHADQFLPVWRRLAGPRRAWVGQFPHINPGYEEQYHPGAVGRPGFTDQAFEWYERFLRGRRSATRGNPRVTVQEGSAGSWRAERRWPPAGVRRRTLPVLSGSYRDAAGNKAEPGCFRFEPNCLPGPSGVGTWTFSPALGRPAHLAGEPKLIVEVADAPAEAHLVGLLYDVGPSGAARLISRGATLLSAAGRHRFRLYPQDWHLREGHRLGLLLSGADDGWFLAGGSGGTVRVSEGKLRVPFLSRTPGRAIPGEPSQIVRERIAFEVEGLTIESRTAAMRRSPPSPK